MACLDFLPFFISLSFFSLISHFSVRTRPRKYNALHCWSRRFIVACFAYSFVYSGTIRVVKVIKTKQIMTRFLHFCLFVCDLNKAAFVGKMA